MIGMMCFAMFYLVNFDREPVLLLLILCENLKKKSIKKLDILGHGGFGHVALCQNKLDGRQYAVKKIRLKDKNPLVNDKILRFYILSLIWSYFIILFVL
jgi:hypothetical protein